MISHKSSKVHRQRLKRLREPVYTQHEAEESVGNGSQKDIGNSIATLIVHLRNNEEFGCCTAGRST
ncbi:unnamed protein product [Brugia timori]|uniref:Uncharacterized protein n=1 Tax=Brugia timori TaxID=42155 RepID=A0A3P7TE42_9BILA|nr:unnamed protein product [Brugia timori]